MNSLQKWINAALIVADAEGMANEEVIPTWPVDCVERFPYLYPQLTVGALRQWQASCSEFPNGSTIGDAPSVAKILIDRVITELEVGFIACNRCGDQEDTATLDCMDDLKRLQDILSMPQAARAQDGGEPVGVVNKSRAGEYEFFPGPALPAMANGMHKVYTAHPPSAVVPEWFNPHSTPPAHYQPVVGYHPEWIDSSNHAGVRECFTTGYGDVWLNSAWLEGADSYQTGKMVPLLWTHMPTPSKQEVIGDELYPSK